jgi:hypothetical protein
MSLIPITASMLYDLVACPHRVSMDLFADVAQRDKISPFVQLLWDRGAAHEKKLSQTSQSPSPIFPNMRVMKRNGLRSKRWNAAIR